MMDDSGNDTSTEETPAPEGDDSGDDTGGDTSGDDTGTDTDSGDTGGEETPAL